MSNRLLIAATGDVHIFRDDAIKSFDAAAKIHAKSDFVLGNCEGVYSDDLDLVAAGPLALRAPSTMAKVLGDAGFHVMSCANNHAMDFGAKGLLDTLESLRAAKIQPVGAASTLEGARAPVFFDVDGFKIAVVARTAVYPPAAAATPTTAGVAPLRVETRYLPRHRPAMLEPGHLPVVRTAINAEDMEELNTAISIVRAQADVVIFSLHCGLSVNRSVLTDYEIACSRAAIDAGADIVFNHHHHMLRGAEIYRGKPIFYSLGHFVLDSPDFETMVGAARVAEFRALGDFMFFPREGYPYLPFHPEARLTAIALCAVDGDGIVPGFVAFRITPENHAVKIGLDTEEGREFLAWLREISSEAGLDTEYEVVDVPGMAGETMIAVRPTVGEEGRAR